MPAYPRERLQIILALEADDEATRIAVDALGLQPPYEIVLAPLEGPRTKPKALNVALAHARGEFCTIYDAEDRPHPHQLTTAVAAFQSRGARLACVQAPLLADNAHASWISAQFAAEYAIQFLTLLPLFSRLGVPLPLGGTSNHFRVDVLREIGGWDSYNVTEDADLGYRLACQGWRAEVIGAPTYEEAPVTFDAWRKQRTRWIKGHLQTWFVLMRNPFRTVRELGLRGFLSMQLVLGGGVLAALIHLPLAALMLTAPLTIVELAAADFMLALIGYAVAIYGGAVGAGLAGSPRIALAALTMPLFWPLLFIPAVGAIIGFALRPFYWAKTTHGVSLRPELPSNAERRSPLSPTPRQSRALSARPARAARRADAARHRG